MYDISNNFNHLFQGFYFANTNIFLSVHKIYTFCTYVTIEQDLQTYFKQFSNCGKDNHTSIIYSYIAAIKKWATNYFHLLQMPLTINAKTLLAGTKRSFCYFDGIQISLDLIDGKMSVSC